MDTAFTEIFAQEDSEADFESDEDTDSDSSSTSDNDLGNVSLDATLQTEDDFSGFEDQGYVDLPHNFDNPDLLSVWEEGSRPHQQLQFTQKPGLRPYANIPESDPLPIDFFSLFIDDSHFEIMARETNTYAEQYISSVTLKPFSRFHRWSPTNKSEMKVFIALTIGMGLVVQRDIRVYWSTECVTATPFFPNTMSRDRFWLIMNFFHLSDNSAFPKKHEASYTPLSKLGFIYQNVVHRFKNLYTPRQYISIDEGTVPWRGNLKFRVYNRDKPKRYGIKAYMLCDSTNGYCSEFKLYTGKSEEEASEGGIVYDLVMKLMQAYLGKGYHVFMDNFYSSPRLFMNLWLCGTGATGTLRINRKGCPKEIKDKKLKKGETCTMHNQNLLLMKYQDRKTVYLLTTVETEEPTPTGRTDRQSGAIITKPSVIATYDKYMGGVDRIDQMLSYNSFHSKTMKWWKRVFFHVLNLAIVNSFILYKDVTQDKKLLHRMYRNEIVRSLIRSAGTDDVTGYQHRAAQRRCSASDDACLRLQGRHFPQKIKPTGVKKNATRTCVVCAPAERKRQRSLSDGTPQKRQRYGHETTFECDSCQAPLCVNICFKLYHTVKDFERAYILQKYGESENERQASPTASASAV